MPEKAVGRVRAQQLDEECHVTGEVRQVRARARRYDERQVRDGMAPTRRPQPRPKAPARRGRAQSNGNQVQSNGNQVQSGTSSKAPARRGRAQSNGNQMAIKWPSNGHEVVIKWQSSGHQVVIKWSSSGHQRTPRGMHRAVQLEWRAQPSAPATLHTATLHTTLHTRRRSPTTTPYGRRRGRLESRQRPPPRRAPTAARPLLVVWGVGRSAWCSCGLSKWEGRRAARRSARSARSRSRPRRDRARGAPDEGGNQRSSG